MDEPPVLNGRVSSRDLYAAISSFREELASERTVEAHVARYGWTCPGWHHPPHPVRPGELAADHLVPLVLGGEPLLHRAGVLCSSCNARKGLSQRRR